VGAVGHYREAIERIAHAHNHSATGAGLGNFYHGQDIRHVIHAAAAVLFGHGHAHEFHFGHLLDNFIGVPMGFIQFGRLGFDLFLGEPPGHVPDHLLFFGQLKIHVNLSQNGLLPTTVI
jgi:hypothetical protein